MLDPTSPHREETINTLLALVLAQHGLMAEAEIITGGASKKLPDVFFKLDGLNVILEGKFARQGTEAAAYAQASQRMIQGLAHITIAIMYPEDLRHVATSEVQTALQRCTFRYMILSETGETEWLEGDVTKLIADIRQAQTALLEDNLVETLAASLGEVLLHAANMWTNETATCEKFSRLLGVYPPSKETPEKTQQRHATAAKIAALVLANALIFQEQLLRTHDNVKPINAFLDADEIMNAAQQHWRWIWQQINYVPIFQLAENVIECIPHASPSRNIPFKNLIAQALKISAKQAALRHDLMGRIYHWLLHEAKYLGTFYTAVPTATLLLKLAIGLDKQRDFGDLETLKNYRVTDLTCGTGTLLMAAADALRDAYIRRRVSDKKSLQQHDMQAFHQVLMENMIFGYDVLPSAVHLTASTLALLAPDVAFNEMNLFVMPLGMDGEQARLGSLDFLDDDKVQTQFSLVGDHLQSIRQSATKITATNATIPAERFDLCVMNPPFVRSVGGNLLFGSLPDEREQLQHELKNRVKHYGASATAGLGSIFVALADKYLKNGGRMAFVLPAALASGEAWAETRDLLASRYHLEIVVSSHDVEHPNFSENTDLSEILFIARKLDKDEMPGDTLYLNLWHNPRGIYRAFDTVMRTFSTPTVALTGQEVCSLRSLYGKTAETFTMSPAQQRENWTGALFAQTDLLRIFCQLKQEYILAIPAQMPTVLRLCQLQTLVSLGPDQRRVHDGFRHSTDEWSPYSGFWNHESKTVTTIEQTPNVFLNIWQDSPRGSHYGAHLWKRSGTLLVAERLRLNTHKLISINLSKPVLCNSWWALDCQHLSEQQKQVLALWLNSSLAILLLFGHRVITEGAWIKLKQPAWEKMPVLNVQQLTQPELKKLAKVYDTLKNKELQAIAKLDQDKVRQAIDDAFSEVLNLPNLSTLRELLAREPGLTGKGLYVPVSYPPTQKKSAKRNLGK